MWTELTERIRFAIKKNLPASLIVAGEISNLTFASSGHIYFTLKDAQSQIACAMWKSKTTRLKFQLAEGQAVLVHAASTFMAREANISFTRKRSPLPAWANSNSPFASSGKSSKRKAYSIRRTKKPIPAYPLTIAVVTSRPAPPSVTSCGRSNFAGPVAKYCSTPSPFRATTRPGNRQAIRDLNDKALQLKIDVVILARGGGSLEDLWAFNEEIVARGIYASKLPIISGVGHEIDVTIADLVADLRAATPTAAASTPRPSLSEVAETLAWHYNHLKNITLKTFELEKTVAQPAREPAHLPQPDATLGSFAQQLDEALNQLNRTTENQLKLSRNRVHNTE